MIVSLLVLCYNSYPKFIRGFFQLFSCTRFPGESNTSRLIGCLDTECYSSEHISWFLSIGLPVLLLIVIGFPMAGLMKLLMEYKRGTLNDPSILSTVGFLYDGKIPPAPMYNRGMPLVIHIHISASFSQSQSQGTSLIYISGTWSPSFGTSFYQWSSSSWTPLPWMATTNKGSLLSSSSSVAQVSTSCTFHM